MKNMHFFISALIWNAQFDIDEEKLYCKFQQKVLNI